MFTVSVYVNNVRHKSKVIKFYISLLSAGEKWRLIGKVKSIGNERNELIFNWTKDTSSWESGLMVGIDKYSLI